MAPKNRNTIRVTIPVTPEVLSKFQRFSEASGLSVGKSMSDWLRDTVQGLDAMTDILEVHKQSPAKAMQQLTLMASTLQDMTSSTIDTMKGAPSPLGEGVPLAGKGLTVAKAAIIKAASFGGLTPPSSNTGGKVAKPPKTPRGLK